MKVHTLESRWYARQPWKNGGGTTAEISLEPGAQRFLWRASIAEVERDGPFSDFSGYARHIMLLEGRGMVLSFDDGEEARLAAPRVPYAFDGGRPVRGLLIDGPVRDLNLIVDRAQASGRIDVVEAWTEAGPLPHADWLLVLAIEGRAAVETPAGSHDLAPGDTLRIDSPEGRLGLRAADTHCVAAVLSIQRRPAA